MPDISNSQFQIIQNVLFAILLMFTSHGSPVMEAHRRRLVLLPLHVVGDLMVVAEITHCIMHEMGKRAEHGSYPLLGELLLLLLFIIAARQALARMLKPIAKSSATPQLVQSPFPMSPNSNRPSLSNFGMKGFTVGGWAVLSREIPPLWPWD